MLFDLRSRGRRRTVQVVYATLALLMGGGLVLFGVGAGNGFGGLLDAFKGGGGSSTAAVSQAEKDALRATRARPGDPAAWAQLVQARYTAAGQGGNYDPNVVNSTTGQQGQYTASGKAELRKASDAWKHYLTLTAKPDADLAQLVARADDITSDYTGEAAAWQIVTQANPTQATYFEYLAQAAYKAKNTRLGDLASDKAISLTPKAEQSTVRQQLAAAKRSATGALTGASNTAGGTVTVPAGGGTVTTTK